ncbi:MAG: hypothetical protein GXO59_00635 [Dictyoglomi bacterium]|nr:hypothetical protein [Dictyoglomota bacterium]
MKKIKTSVILLIFLALLLSSCGSPTTTNKSIALRLTPDFEKGAYILTVEKEGNTATITENLYPLPMLTPSLTSYALLDGKVVYLEGISQKQDTEERYTTPNIYNIHIKTYNIDTGTTSVMLSATYTDAYLYKLGNKLLFVGSTKRHIQGCMLHGRTPQCKDIFSTAKDIYTPYIDVFPTPTGLWVHYDDNIALFDGNIKTFSYKLWNVGHFREYIVGTNRNSSVILSPTGQSWVFTNTSSVRPSYAIGDSAIAISYVPQGDSLIHIIIWTDKVTTDDITLPIHENVVLEFTGSTLAVSPITGPSITLTVDKHGNIVDKHIPTEYTLPVKVVHKRSTEGDKVFYIERAGKLSHMYTCHSPMCTGAYLSYTSTMAKYIIADDMDNKGIIYLYTISFSGDVSSETIYTKENSDVLYGKKVGSGMWIVLGSLEYPPKYPLTFVYLTQSGEAVPYTEKYLGDTPPIYEDWLSLNIKASAQGSLWVQTSSQTMVLYPSGEHHFFNIAGSDLIPYKDGVLTSIRTGGGKFNTRWHLAYITGNGIQWQTQNFLKGYILGSSATPNDIWLKLIKDKIYALYMENSTLYLLTLDSTGHVSKEKVSTLPTEKHITYGIVPEINKNMLTIVAEKDDTEHKDFELYNIAIARIRVLDGQFQVKTLVPYIMWFH